MTTDRERISTNSYNPRLGFYDENVKRGTIYDANMTPLAYSVFNGSMNMKENIPLEVLQAILLVTEVLEDQG